MYQACTSKSLFGYPFIFLHVFLELRGNFHLVFRKDLARIGEGRKRSL